MSAITYSTRWVQQSITDPGLFWSQDKKQFVAFNDATFWSLDRDITWSRDALAVPVLTIVATDEMLGQLDQLARYTGQDKTELVAWAVNAMWLRYFEFENRELGV